MVMSSFNEALGTTLEFAPIRLSDAALDADFNAALDFEMDEIKLILEAAQTPLFELHDHAMSIEADQVPMANFQNFLFSTIDARMRRGVSHTHPATAQLYAQLQSSSAADKWALPRLIAIEYLVRCLDGKASWHVGLFSTKHGLKHNCLRRCLTCVPHALDLLCDAFIVQDQVIAHTETVLAQHKIAALSGHFFKRLQELGVPRGASCALTATISCWYLDSWEIHAVDLVADVAAL
ncbi:hypothetical protein SPRG_01353 [Saprolegnia parasitica CBS 223.65]|uniref:Uncharacterized protein n=1 Tax=Saprolegnia parasitica (strain CBS 223.65) TaxID=695850 RepID=A0A067CTP9_SAPPC|nr:hypothetical protein SPRG_01353 [Saprolegnia parasitica CBS 223.65]KDO34079.1 hypothetical protein SPRG_01353 [Saprolegnia parasitica CBS 223.65]|eukprot:XP_012194963.1 hypothetical protein SPRG_01353 [Saprolegnia parasitica CBS 223.65]